MRYLTEVIMARFVLLCTVALLFLCLSALSSGLTAQTLLSPPSKTGTGSTLLLHGQKNSTPFALGIGGGSASSFLGPGLSPIPGTPTNPLGGIQIGGNNPFQLPLSTPSTLTTPGRPDYLVPGDPPSGFIQLPSSTIRLSPNTKPLADTGQTTAPPAIGNETNQRQQESIARSILQDLIGDSDVSPLSSSSSGTNVETPSVLKGTTKTGAAILTESETNDDRFERELRQERQKAEKIEDPDKRQKALDEVQRKEETRQLWLDQRQKTEQGADFFVVPPLKERLLKEGWCQLFDGQTSFGWQTPKTGYYSGGVFNFGSGEIQSNPLYPGLLYTTNQFGDFSLRFDYQADPDDEVLLLLKTPPTPKDLYSSCYTVVLNSGRPDRPRGLILGRQQYSEDELRSLTDIQQREEAGAKNDSGRLWHSFAAKFDRSQLILWVDRREPIIFLDPKPIQYGYVGLLVAKGNARFRNILWQPGAPMPVFDQYDKQKGWRAESENVKFSQIQENVYRLTGGPGSIESLETFGNFVLQLEYYNGMTSSRSSLFFRSIPQQYQSGYEISLQNFPTRQDRDSMVGVDAGSFRDIKDARYVRPPDQEWNFLTLVAVDRHFQTWINGVPVCEITDSRKAKEDSKEGPFLKAGTLQFYAPSEGTLIQYRNIKIAPMHEGNEGQK
jgi:hypothetical protein